jgi:hypothetical protein
MAGDRVADIGVQPPAGGTPAANRGIAFARRG